ncbi:tipN [Asticcacaulis sp. EMRT-3]|uniref:tipN n=1 Tax=Asticcacaulis sp. EMRT-3 TaxID=3040349 RepID=UPI0024AFB7B2|nr:tipN [Asticcacaulis sp. EMRT-3]MDI7775204.1 tipN [Asticcacaulis sp. EMRT-3]
MKSRRPPLNLTERAKSRARQDEAMTDANSGEEGDDMEDDAEMEASDSDPADDILDAPLHPSVTAPEDTKAAANKDFAIPEPFTVTPPPPAAPPVRAEKPVKSPARKETRDLTAQKISPEGVLKTTGMPPFYFWGAATFISLLWGMGLVAFALGAQSHLTAFAYQPFTLAILALFALFPIGLVFASAFALRNAAALAREARRTAQLADAMSAPALVAASETGSLVEALRAQVDHAVRAVRLAHADISELSGRLKTETDRLQDAAQIARTSTQSITRSLQNEREAIAALSESLGAQANGIVEATERQARMVADASDLAQTQLREAEASLAASAGQMINAAADVSNAARTASEDLDRQTVRLETAGSGVSDQIRSVEDGLSQQRAGLVSAALSLRADQEDFAVHIENQRAQLTEALTITRVATVDLGETSARGIDVLRDILVQAQSHFQAVNAAAENERTAFETRIHATLSNISIMAADARDDLVEETRRSLEQLNIAATEARRAAGDAAQTAQMRVDRLNETIFEASKKADEVFDARFAAARRLIEDSAELISSAGDQTAQRLDASFVHTRETLAEVHAALNEIAGSADSLPAVAQARIADIRRSVEEGIAATMAAAKKAAEETEAVDAAFQDRVKRNYDMLNEAVRLMGVISGDSPMHGALSTAEPLELQTPARERDYGRTFGSRREAPAPTPAPAPAQPVGSRLRLSPLGAETRPATHPPAAQPSQPSPQRGQEGWSWRELLGGMEGREQPKTAAQTPSTPAPHPPPDPEFDSLDEVMAAEISAMGIDATALLSRARLDETVAAILAEDNEGARLVVRRVAPAAIRRLNRRLVSDAVMRQQATDFIGYYDQQVNMALMARDKPQALGELFGSAGGRAYLLFDAAISDLI